jgi:hypothetical protein
MSLSADGDCACETTMIEHQIDLKLASGADLKILYFSDREMRWIFSYNYRGDRKPGETPDIVNEVRLTAEYADGILTPMIVLSMHVVIPARLGQQFVAGVDVSPGAKTYLEFHYEKRIYAARKVIEYRLVEICKGARERVKIDADEPAIVRPIAFPFPIPEGMELRDLVSVPFRLDNGEIAHFDLPARTLR